MSSNTIELKIDSARKQSELLYKTKGSWQEEVDNLLDRMNELGGLLNNIHSILLSLNFEIERDSQNFKESEKAPAAIKSLTTTISKILILVRKSSLYPGVKSIFRTIKTENNYLRELLHDRKVGIELDSDDEMKDIINRTLNAVKKK